MRFLPLPVLVCFSLLGCHPGQLPDSGHQVHTESPVEPAQEFYRLNIDLDKLPGKWTAGYDNQRSPLLKEAITECQATLRIVPSEEKTLFPETLVALSLNWLSVPHELLIPIEVSDEAAVASFLLPTLGLAGRMTVTKRTELGDELFSVIMICPVENGYFIPALNESLIKAVLIVRRN